MTTHQQPMLFLSLCLVALTTGVCLSGCASSNPSEGSGQEINGFVDIGALPLDTRRASSLALIDGAPPEMAGAGTTVEDTSLVIDSTSLDYSYAGYVFGVPLDATLNYLDIDVDAVTTKYWVGISGYGTTGGWEWQGPFYDDTRIDFDATFANYLSPNNNLYWVVLTTDDHYATLVSTTVAYEPWQIQLRLPPGGQQFAAPAPALSPSLILMPAIDDWADEGAPVIFHTAPVESSQHIHFAYFNGTEWKQRRLQQDDSPMTQPSAFRTGSGGVIFAYDHTAGIGGTGQIVMLTTDDTWVVTATETIGTIEGKSLSHFKVDYDPETGDYLILHGYSVDPLHEVYITTGQADSWTTLPITGFTGDKIAGSDVSFDPVGGQPWAVFSSGTLDESSTFMLDFRLNLGRFDGSEWSWTTVDNESPLTVDLSFKPDNSPQLVMISVRDWILSMPPFFSITASILADISIGEFNGSAWNFTQLHTSEISLDEIFNYQLGVDLGIDCSWATPNSLSFSRADGFVTFATSPFTITDGTLINHTKFYIDSGSGYEESAFFTGDPGATFSWQTGGSVPMCAYLFAEELDIGQALGGNVDIANDLIFWKP